MGARIVLDQAPHAAQFAYGWNGTCTFLALAAMVTASQRRSKDQGVVQSLMNTLAHDAANKGLCYPFPNGGCTLYNIAREAVSVLGVGPIYQRNFDNNQQVIPFDEWHNLLLAHAGIHPILMQVANGKALVDANSGKRDQWNLQYHAICIVGKEDRGYVVCDGDNPNIANDFAYYTKDTLLAAQPCGLLIMPVVAAPPAPPPPPPAPAPVAVDWQAKYNALSGQFNTLSDEINRIKTIIGG